MNIDKSLLTPQELEYLEELDQAYNFGFEFVQSQLDVLDALKSDSFDEVILAAGRSWGKDLTVGAYIHDYCMTHTNKRVMFITPFFSQIDSFIDQVLKGTNDETGKDFIPKGLDNDPLFTINHSKKEIVYKTGSRIICRSAENPQAIRSKRANIIVINEAAFIPLQVIQTQIYAVLKKGTKAKIIWISTPNGKDHFYDKFVEGLDNPEDEDFNLTQRKPKVKSFRYTYLNNSRSALNVPLMKESLTERQFDQEVMVKFYSDSEVFSNLNSALYEVNFDVKNHNMNHWEEAPIIDIEMPHKSHVYVAGWDIATEKDWSVVIIMDANTGKIVSYTRFNKMDVDTQCQKVLNICSKWNNASLLFDGTSLGGTAFGDTLYRLNKNPKQSVTPFIFNYESKNTIINELIMRIEREENWIPNLPMIVSEFRSLSRDRTQTGKPKYAASSGKHDDIVMAIALANICFIEIKKILSYIQK